MYLLRHFLARLVVLVDFLCLGEGNLGVGVREFLVLHYLAVAVDFEVTLVGVDDDVVVLVAAIRLGDDGAEALLEHADERRTVNVFRFLEFLEHVGQADGVLFC